MQGIDPHMGFLPSEEPLERLPAEFDAWEQVASELPALLLTGQVRSVLQDLVRLDVSKLEGNRALERAMLLLSVFGNAYVWGCEPAATIIPRNLAAPWSEVAAKLGRPPILSYASIVLHNWRKVNRSAPFALENIVTLLLFHGGMDEQWFYLTAVDVEAKGASALQAIVNAQSAVAVGDEDRLISALAQLATTLTTLSSALRRVPEKCDPYIFYHRVRPFVFGWKEPGIIYEGVSATPQQWAGASAAQSSLLQAIDIGLGIQHSHPVTQSFLRDVRQYMPIPHRQFLQALEAGPGIRPFILNPKRRNTRLNSVYNECIRALETFRKIHMGFSVEYILNQASQAEGAAGTGGTEFVPFLREMGRETKRSVIVDEAG